MWAISSMIATILAIWSPFNSSLRLVLAAIAIFLFVLAFGFALHRTEPYGSYHIALNTQPGNAKRPDTEWLNMGYWEDTKEFPQACETLALRLIEVAQCVPGGRVLGVDVFALFPSTPLIVTQDVGHACGDSLLLHLSHLEVPRPTSLTGITSLPSQHVRSRERVATHQSSTAHLQDPRACEVTLFRGDAIHRPGDIDHPLDSSSSTPPFTTILALDCAYHFASRETFLQQSFARLAPGGSIALGDLVISYPLPFGLQTVLSRLLSVRSENMITPRVYEEQLKTIGYTNVRMEDISDNVFPGLRRFLKSRGGLWRILEILIGSWERAGGRFLIVSATKPEALA